MNIEKAQALIEDHFRNRVEKDPKIRNAYLLVHSETLGIHLKIAEGSTNKVPANENQPYFIASIGKLFTSVLAGIPSAQLARLQGEGLCKPDKNKTFIESHVRFT